MEIRKLSKHQIVVYDNNSERKIVQICMIVKKPTRRNQSKKISEKTCTMTQCSIQIQLGGIKIKNSTQAEYLGWGRGFG